MSSIDFSAYAFANAATRAQAEVEFRFADADARRAALLARELDHYGRCLVCRRGVHDTHKLPSGLCQSCKTRGRHLKKLKR